MHTSTLRKVGGSTLLAVPPAMLDTLDLKAGITVGIAIEDGHLVIHPIPRPNYTLEELLAMATDTTVTEPASPEERDWLHAPATGKELLQGTTSKNRFSTSREPCRIRTMSIPSSRGKQKTK